YLSYIGHSLGTTQLFILLSLQPEFEQFFRPFIALAPIAYLGNTLSLFKALAPIEPLVRPVTVGLGLPRPVAQYLCVEYNALLYGQDPFNTDHSRLPAIFGNAFDDTSSRIYLHFAQLILNDKFSQFNYGTDGNVAKYGQLSAPEYPLGNITSQDIVLVHGLNDLLADVLDVQRLANKIHKLRAFKTIRWPQWDHLDFKYKCRQKNTDCGVDDAMAIMLATYCHKQNLIDIMAITCQFGNTYVDNVVKNVGYTLNASDIKGIKIYRGCDGPLNGKYVLEEYYGTDGLGDSTKDMPPIDVAIEREPAANALVRLAREHPKQITLIALGPLTNIASAYILNNKFFDNLKKIVLMSGSLNFDGNTYPVTSFNIISDVEACSIVLSNANCAVTVVPNECCKSNILTWDIYDQIVKLGSKKSMFMKQITDMEIKDTKEKPGTKGIVMFDILAIIAAIYEDYIESKVEYKTSVELKGRITRGKLVFKKRSTPDVLKNDWKSVQYIKHFNEKKLSQLYIDFMK
ncbi:unnamed protein product, partial [Medioppia subpectinata]